MGFYYLRNTMSYLPIVKITISSYFKKSSRRSNKNNKVFRKLSIDDEADPLSNTVRRPYSHDCISAELKGQLAPFRRLNNRTKKPYSRNAACCCEPDGSAHVAGAGAGAGVWRGRSVVDDDPDGDWRHFRIRHVHHTQLVQRADTNAVGSINSADGERQYERSSGW